MSNNISSIGENLNILISCNYEIADDWMAFLCWYSLSKNLPEAKAMISCNKISMKSTLFNWVHKLNVPFMLHKPFEKKEDEIEEIQAKWLILPESTILVIKPETVAIRDFDESGIDVKVFKEGAVYINEVENLCCEAKEDKICPFVTYTEGWGKFVTSKWINNNKYPFGSGSFSHSKLNSNEIRIKQLWNSVTPLIQAITRR